MPCTAQDALMYPGHFAIGLAIKAKVPRAPTIGLMIGVGLLDYLYGVFVMFGIEGGTFRHLDCTWSHSLVMSLLYSALFAAAFYRWGTRVVAAMAIAVFSHFMLDVLSHNPDMDLWPHSAVEMGLGPYFGGFGGWFELLVSVSGCSVYVLCARRNGTFGRSPIVVCAMVALTYIAEVVAVHGSA